MVTCEGNEWVGGEEYSCEGKLVLVGMVGVRELWGEEWVLCGKGSELEVGVALWRRIVAEISGLIIGVSGLWWMMCEENEWVRRVINITPCL